jgi:hypothetical protein
MGDLGTFSDLKATWLLSQVNRRKKRAKKLGLPEALCEFYQHARSYPASQNKHGSMVPKSLSDLHGEPNSVSFTYQDNRYYLQLEHTVSMPDGELLGRIELQINGKRVLEISVSQYEYGPWHAGDVTAFSEGPWAKSFKALAAEAQRLYDRQVKLGFQDEEVLRDRFDIAPGFGFQLLTKLKNFFAEFLKRPT